MTQTFFCIVFDNKFLRGCLHEKTGTGASFIPGWLFDFVSRLHDDWAISSCYLRVHFMLIEYTCDSKLQTLRMGYPFQSKSGPISHQNGWSFCIYMIPLWDFVLEWYSHPHARTGVNSRQGDSCRHDILWWYHVNKYRAMRGNWSELAPGRKSPLCHVNTPLHVHCICKLLHFVLCFQQTRNGSYMFVAGVVKHWMQTDVHVDVS